METESQRPRGREGAVSALSAATEALNLAEKNSSITSAKAVFNTASNLLTIVRVCFLLVCHDLFQVYI